MLQLHSNAVIKKLDESMWAVVKSLLTFVSLTFVSLTSENKEILF